MDLGCTGPGRFPCRKCKNCLGARRRKHTRLAMQAYYTHPRRHFQTLTFRPGISRSYRFIQRYLKRVRKNCGIRFKYIVTEEPHKRLDSKGRQRMHFHLIIFTHDRVSGELIRKCWKGGISHSRLAQPSDVKYVCKYITKHNGQVRKSGGLDHDYWQAIEAAPSVSAALVAFPGAQVFRVREHVRDPSRRKYATSIYCPHYKKQRPAMWPVHLAPSLNPDPTACLQMDPCPLKPYSGKPR